jgi:ribonuclease HI
MPPTVFERWKRLPDVQTNNEAEYEGVLLAVKTALEKDISSFLLRTDSRLIVNQFYDLHRASNDSLKIYLQELKSLSRDFEHFTLKWIPRLQNKRADALCRKALRPPATFSRSKVFPKEIPVHDSPPTENQIREALGIPRDPSPAGNLSRWDSESRRG